MIEKWVGKSIQKSKFSKNSALFVQFEVFRKNPQLTQNKIVRFHSISWGFNCTNLHPSTETVLVWRVAACDDVSIVQTYILQLKQSTVAEKWRSSVFQLYKLTSFNWNMHSSFRACGGKSFNCTNLHPSTETAVLLLIVLIFLAFQLYKLTSFNWNEKKK